MNCNSDFEVNISQKTETEQTKTFDCDMETRSESKVVVQVLPSVGLSSISALAEYNAFSIISVKSKRLANVSCSSDSFKSETPPSSSSGNWSSEESYANLDEISNNRSISEFGQIYPSKNKQVVKRSLKKRNNLLGTKSICSIFPGNGMKLLDIKHVSYELEKSIPQVTRILHYLLFGMYGLISTESLLQKSRQNILQFSGFPFAVDSDMCIKKKKALSHLPYPLLVLIHKILINSAPIDRSTAVDTLIQFLQKPTDEHISNEMPDKLQNELSENEIEKLKTVALEANPFVLLERLKENVAEKVLKEEKEKEENFEHQKFSENYVKPSFIRNGTGVHLKCFPEIVNNVHRARRRIINLLHSLLYGRPGSEFKNRQNILEFNGFTSSQEKFLARKLAFLKRLRAQELLQLCDVFSSRVKSENENKKIIKLLMFLASPEELNPHKTRRKRSINRSKMNDDFLYYGRAKKGDPWPNKKDSEDTICETVARKQSVKLGDFDTIRSKVECATPDFLFELNDLLFVRPCDNSEIHQKILDFTSFGFNVNSFDFHYRKTLMHYMDMKTIRKIADLLDIENWEYCRSHQDLSKNILDFLMNMKLPDKKRKSASNQKDKSLKCRPNIMKLYSSRDFPKPRSCSPENVDSTYASEELNENDCELNIETPFPYYKNTAAHSRYQLKNGLFSKEKQGLSDSTPLFEFIQHPTDKELYHKIDKIISSAPLSITLEDLIKEVLKCYPEYNLQYRIDFIRSKALEVLQEMRENIVIFSD